MHLHSVKPQRKKKMYHSEKTHYPFVLFLESINKHNNLDDQITFIKAVKKFKKSFLENNLCNTVFDRQKVSELMANKLTRFKVRFVENMILDSPQEYFKKYYNRKTSFAKLNALNNLYSKNKLYFPLFTNISIIYTISNNVRRKQLCLNRIMEDLKNRETKQKKYEEVSDYIIDDLLEDDDMNQIQFNNEGILDNNKFKKILAKLNKLAIDSPPKKKPILNLKSLPGVLNEIVQGSKTPKNYVLQLINIKTRKLFSPVKIKNTTMPFFINDYNSPEKRKNSFDEMLHLVNNIESASTKFKSMIKYKKMKFQMMTKSNTLNNFFNSDKLKSFNDTSQKLKSQINVNKFNLNSSKTLVRNTNFSSKSIIFPSNNIKKQIITSTLNISNYKPLIVKEEEARKKLEGAKPFPKVDKLYEKLSAFNNRPSVALNIDERNKAKLKFIRKVKRETPTNKVSDISNQDTRFNSTLFKNSIRKHTSIISINTLLKH